ncbi:unnamed protein product [Chrysodeixis includens]|uniref:Uncharacterized protein n=1 Tax=Chrysodeixis includens TaxID=689277 RepID=A0A9N8KXZ0_CHRIL|nr:unnamed protein product [Chrysodeixis includens]
MGVACGNIAANDSARVIARAAHAAVYMPRGDRSEARQRRPLGAARRVTALSSVVSAAAECVPSLLYVVWPVLGHSTRLNTHLENRKENNERVLYCSAGEDRAAASLLAATCSTNTTS